MKIHKLSVTSSVSKSKHTFGFNSLKLTDQDDFSCKTIGSGYDMFGTILGRWVEVKFQNILHSLDVSKYYGLSTENGKYRIDGGCGLDCVFKIIHALGFEVERIYTSNKISAFIIYQSN